MKDTELIERIAEIADVEFVTHDNKLCFYKENGDFIHSIDPLNDSNDAKAFCFDLMVEYNVNVFHNDNNYTAWGYDMNSVVTDTSLQKAILLAVVKKHENKTN